tara:strand:+ start:993 stop:1187 length:195 start_codon:yes stop_codon:yes gene_type:complete
LDGDIVRSGKLMNTIDEKIMSVRAVDLGLKAIKTKRGNVSAHHYRISGGLVRDVWYDGEETLHR